MVTIFVLYLNKFKEYFYKLKFEEFCLKILYSGWSKKYRSYSNKSPVSNNSFNRDLVLFKVNIFRILDIYVYSCIKYFSTFLCTALKTDHSNLNL